MTLDEKNEDLQLLGTSQQDPQVLHRRRIQSTVHIFFLYCVIASLIIVVLALFTRPHHGECKDPSQGIYSPAQDVIEYETQVFDENFQSKGPYMGRPDGMPDAGIPTNETDALWDDLYQCMFLPPPSFLPFPSPFSIQNPQELTANGPCPSSPTVGISEIPYSAARQLPNATE
ncbi:hypothetical protein MMC29_008223 [Sticta canariensis]|nr:hypothetical protein [Sticta canariensis]